MAEPKRRGRLRIAFSARRSALPSDIVEMLPPMFNVIAEAVIADDAVVDACDVVGRDLAALGVSLDEALRDLRATIQLAARRDPSFDETHALSLGWSEATLGYLHGLSCVDPLTGLTTQAHLREAMAAVYRDDVPASHALVVVDSADRGLADLPVSSARTMTLLGQHSRSVFARDETISQVGNGRIVVLCDRTEGLGERVALLRRMVGDSASRVWIEGLPSSEGSAAFLLDELARTTH
jgi:hypothetical protein